MILDDQNLTALQTNNNSVNTQQPISDIKHTPK